MDPSAQVQQTDPVAAAFVLTLAAGTLGLLWWRGVLTPDSLNQAPRRSANLTWIDLIVGFGLLIFGLSLAGMMVGRMYPPASPMPTGEEQDPGQMLAAMIGSQLGMLPAVIYTLYRLGVSPEPRRLASIPQAVRVGVVGLVVLLPLLAGTSVVIGLVNAALGREVPQIAHDALQALLDQPWGAMRWTFIISAVLIAPMVEEVLFRGLVQTTIAENLLAGRRWLAIVITSVVFALIHLEVSAVEALPILVVLSIGLGYVYERTGRLWAPIALHACFNGLQVMIGLAITAQDV